MLGAVSERELKQLPLRALVALAVRCARRVQPLFRVQEDASELRVYVGRVERAIRLGEAYARGQDPQFDLDEKAQVDVRASEAYDAAEVAPEAASSRAAAVAARAAAAASAANSDINDATEAAYYVIYAMDSSCAAVKAVGDPNEIIEAIRRDYEVLAGLELGRFPEAGAEVDVSEEGPLGSLWPEGPPVWYAEKFAGLRKILDELEGEDEAAEE